MATLFQAKDGSHFYIVVGKSQGTFQITREGLFRLAQWGIRLPRPGRQDEGVSLSRGTFHKLRDNGYLFTKGLSLAASRPSSSKPDDDDDELGDRDEALSGLPLLLTVNPDDQGERWQLSLDLSALGEETWRELLRLAGSPAEARLLTGPPALTGGRSLRELAFLPRLPVPPQGTAYELWCRLPNGCHRLQTVPQTPGLGTDWQGTLFVEEEELETEEEKLLRRLRRGESVKLYPGRRLYWLVRSNLDAEQGLLEDWPGSKRQIGPPCSGWQLWELELTPAALVTPDCETRLKRWLTYSDLKPQRSAWSLMLLSPPLLLPEEGPPVLGPCPKVVVGCRPPADLASFQSGHAGTITLDLRLKQEGNGESVGRRFALTREITMVYVALDGLAPGAYQLWQENQPGRLAFVIASRTEEVGAALWPSEVLAGLRCTAVTPDGSRQEFAAFSSASTARAAITAEPHRLQLTTAEEGAALSWELAPDGFPITVAWQCSHAGLPASGAGPVSGWQRHPDLVTTGEQLTALWQQQIWPALSRASQARLILDGSALGCLEISLQPAARPVAAAPLISAAQRAQLLWLSYCITALPAAEPAPALPVALEQRLRSLEQAAHRDDPPLALALRRLLRARLPLWVALRLLALLQGQ
uniref:Uncharacterized protein n=1 Tax=Thermogemmatispora argillosa TaxID=2045280 RepID=A0A455SXL6_9CHLR|nr:hypothetical protein KTA_13060 [Thermogemmatispora argillosa]